jgi:serine protease Do
MRNASLFSGGRWLLPALLLWGGNALPTSAQDLSDYPALPRYLFRDGEETLAAFAPISAATRDSIVELNVDGIAVALGTVVDANGLALTKASQIKPGKLTCWLAEGKEVPAQVLGVDEHDDVALLRIEAEGLKPIRWAAKTVAVGQWAITPALADTPQAVGIISALQRRIVHASAYIGVRFDRNSKVPQVDALMPGMGAEKAGIEPGDVIVAINDELVTTRERVVEIVGGLNEGQTVKVRWVRGGHEFGAEVKLMSEYSRQRNDLMSGDTSERAGGFDEAIEHDTVVPPWLCGGPLVNLDGEAIGLNIARASRVATYALPAPLAQKILETLKSAAAPAGK